MGFGVFIFIPLLIILLLCGVITKRRFFGYAILSLIGGAIILFSLSQFFQWITSPKILKKEDYYGTYHIKRDLFPGKADWQYNSYNFVIKDNDSIYFNVVSAGKVSKVYKGKIETVCPYQSARLKLWMDFPAHHILASDPTVYRSPLGFYLVFYSSKYNNVFFEKD
ncbi:hypothetical protein [Sphingobacterium sp. UBA7038]|uniref:hypothetical protein n=1 Tax=Sphingobacterium sp. UBA7038 TaxID=1947515 RepID=UPI00257C62AE|nr:hypothetical protein [Sphingobacterium sp. UBA7038]